MQVAESEIVIAVSYKSYYRRLFLVSSVSVVCFIGLFIFTMNILLQADANASGLPAFQESFRQGIGVSVGLLVFILMLYSIFLIILTRRIRVPSPDLRISHEGIFTSPNAFLIRWSEIRELSQATFMGSPSLQIVLRNGEAVASRAKASTRPSVRFLLPLAVRSVRPWKSATLMAVSQMALPVSIDELLTTIQEHLAPELREHHITVRGSQQ